MNYLRMAVVLSLLVGPLAGSAEATVVKCRDTPGGIPIRNTTALVMVDGKVVDSRALKAANGAAGENSDRIAGIKREDILRIDAMCLEVTEAGVKVRMPAVSVITRPGAVSFMRSRLPDVRWW